MTPTSQQGSPIASASAKITTRTRDEAESQSAATNSERQTTNSLNLPRNSSNENENCTAGVAAAEFNQRPVQYETSTAPSTPNVPTTTTDKTPSNSLGSVHRGDGGGEDRTQGQEHDEEDWDFKAAFQDTIGKPGREALHKFFYPSPRDKRNRNINNESGRDNSTVDAVAAPAPAADAYPNPNPSCQQSPPSPNNTAAAADASPAAMGTSLDNKIAPGRTTRQHKYRHSHRDPLQNRDNRSSNSISSDDNGNESNDQDDNDDYDPRTLQHDNSSGRDSLHREPDGLHRQQPQHHYHHSRSQDWDATFAKQAAADRQFVERFWTVYDDIIMLSLFTQLGILFRLAASWWFAYFDNVFSAGSALFTVLPLNCLSCFLAGLLCSGERLMEIIATRFTPPVLQHDLQPMAKTKTGKHGQGGDEDQDNNDDDNDEENVRGTAHTFQESINDDADDMDDNDDLPVERMMVIGADEYEGGALRRRRRRQERRLERQRHRLKRQKQHQLLGEDAGRDQKQQRRQAMSEQYEQPNAKPYFHSWQPPVHLNDDLRDVQLFALERRIRQSKCLVLFPVRKEDVDVMEHYFDGGYQKQQRHHSQSQQEQGTWRRRSNRSCRSRPRGSNTVQNDDDDRNYSSADSDDLNLEDLVLEEKIEATPAEEARRWKQHSLLNRRRNKSISPLHAAGHGRGSTDNKSASPKTPSSPNSMQTDGRKQSPLNSNAATLPAAAGINAQEMAFQNGVGTEPFSKVQVPTGNPDNNVGATEGDSAQAQGVDIPNDLNQIVQDVSADVTENISRLKRVNLADGWDVGTTPEAMSDDLMLGLRDGFCGALSSFSSWNSAMVTLMKHGQIGTAIVGYMLGLQLNIVAYRFGQHVAVYYFVWRCRQETRRDERRGYGIRVAVNEYSDSGGDNNDDGDTDDENQANQGPRGVTEQETPSVRAVATAIFVMALVTQFTSLSFYSDPRNQKLALSLLFSPLGVIARWRLSKLNTWRPSFPIGTFTANILACALSGGLGSLLAGNPGPRKSILLQSFINGFGGTLSSVAAFIVEILAGVDPILFRFDGFIYAALSIFWAMVTGFVFTASLDWADETSSGSS